jgi:hypothetical protein
LLGKDLLQKIGWTEGEGLGKRGQGIVKPLDGVRLANGQEKLADLLKPTKSAIVLLQNICGAGDVGKGADFMRIVCFFIFSFI